MKFYSVCKRAAESSWHGVTSHGSMKVLLCRVSLIGFDNGAQTERMLDGKPLEMINANLSSEADTTSAQTLPENLNIIFQGPVKVGKFEISPEEAARLLPMGNPNGLPNSLVIKPWMNAPIWWDAQGK